MPESTRMRRHLPGAPTHTMNPITRWLPAETHRGLMRRGLIVVVVALLIAVMNWFNKPGFGSLAEALVYSYAISLLIWCFSDPLRIAAHRWLGTQGPHYWALTPRTITWLLGSAILGYAMGTWLGDRFANVSTFAMLTESPRRFWGFLLSSLAISVGFVVFFYLRERTQVLQRQATEAQLRLLETQLEPHMLFNTLATLRALITTDAPRAVTMLDRLGDYLRATLRASRSSTHTLQDEFDRLRDYLDLMAIRMGPRLQFALELPEPLAQHPLPPLLLQPLVENAIRHGLEPHLAGGEIRVSAQVSGGDLLLTVSDSGAGCNGAPQAGFGLGQVRERLATAFGGRDRLSWHSEAGHGTRIALRLPLQADRMGGAG